MSTQAVHCRILCDTPAAESLTASRQWVLTAMRLHGPALVSLLWRILGNEQDVCDAYQDTFLRLAHLTGDGKPQKIKAYLFRTAANVAISIMRRKTLHNRTCRQIALNQEELHNKRPGDDLDLRELQMELRDNITRLPDYLRQVVLLRELAELPYDQIARILGITAATARVYRCRALRMLAAWMADRKVR